MATQGHYLVTRTVNDATSLLAELEQTRTVITRIVERMGAIGATALDDYEWPDGYAKGDFVALYTALNGLPGSVVADEVRDALFELASHIQ